MHKTIASFVIALSLTALAPQVFAQDIPKPDKKGNYSLSLGPVDARKNYAGSLWYCNVKQLPVRQDANLKSKVLFYLKKGETIPAYIGMGGSDEVLKNAKDPQGRTWMRVLLPAKYGEAASAYVRANSRYLRPVLPKGVKEEIPVLADEVGDEAIEVAAPAGGPPKAGVAANGKNSAPAGKAGGTINVNVNVNLNAPPAGKAGGAKAAPVAGAAAAPPAPVVGGMALQFAPGWTNWSKNGNIYSVSPDNTARVVLVKVTDIPKESPWDDVQGRMAKVLAPHYPGLVNLKEVKTEHDVDRGGVGMREVTYSANFDGQEVDLVVDFARENNVDGKGLVLITRCTRKGDKANQAKADQVAKSLRLKK